MNDFIGIDASRAEKGISVTGVELYSRKIIEEIVKISKGKTKIVLYSRVKLDMDLPGNVENRILSCEKLFTVFHLQKEIISHPPKVLFIPSAAIPFKIPKNTKCITTIHDVAFEIIKNEYSFSQKLYLKNSTKRALKNCEKIIVPSESTKNDLVKIFGAKKEKLKKISMGFDKNSRKSGKLKKGNYFIYIGRIEKKKNLGITIKAFEKFSDKYPDFEFLLLGKDGFGANEIKNTAENLENVKFLGFVSNKKKQELLSMAKALILPSFYEGFGFPILEAQNLGIPVLCSKIPSNIETSGESAIFFNPRNEQKIEDSFEKILDEKFTKKLIKEGQKNVEKYSWEKCGEETFELLEKFI